MSTDDKPTLAIIGEDGNSFSILGKARQTLRQAGYSDEKIKEFFDEATAGDYDHLLQTCMKWFEVE